jgi:hypothetical protein
MANLKTNCALKTKELAATGELTRAELTPAAFPSDSLSAAAPTPSSAVNQAETIAARRKDATSLSGVCYGSDDTFTMMSHHPGAQMVSIVGPKDLCYSAAESLRPVDFTKCLRSTPLTRHY